MDNEYVDEVAIDKAYLDEQMNRRDWLEIIEKPKQNSILKFEYKTGFKWIDKLNIRWLKNLYIRFYWWRFFKNIDNSIELIDGKRIKQNVLDGIIYNFIRSTILNPKSSNGKIIPTKIRDIESHFKDFKVKSKYDIRRSIMRLRAIDKIEIGYISEDAEISLSGQVEYMRESVNAWRNR